jgi:hypothetical protein
VTTHNRLSIILIIIIAEDYISGQQQSRHTRKRKSPEQHHTPSKKAEGQPARFQNSTTSRFLGRLIEDLVNERRIKRAQSKERQPSVALLSSPSPPASHSSISQEETSQYYPVSRRFSSELCIKDCEGYQAVCETRWSGSIGY